MDEPSADVIKAAVETYNLEISVDPLNKEALASAISSAIRVHEQAVVEHVAAIAEDYAEELAFEAEDSDDEDGEIVAGDIALKWFAQKLRKDIPKLAVTKSYKPADGDLVEVILIGTVSIEDTQCSNCGEVENHGHWSVDTPSGEYFFEPKTRLKVRVLSKKEVERDKKA